VAVLTVKGRRASTLNIAEALSGGAKLEGIRWMLGSGGAPRKALRRELCALLPAPDMLGSCQVRYARFGPGRKLTAYYDAHVRIEGTERYCSRPVAVTWGSDGDADQHDGTADLAETQAEAVRHGVAAPFRQLVADVPALGMHVQVSPLDVRFPQLVRVSDPRYARSLVADAFTASGATPHQALAGHYVVTSVRYRPGKRHVLRYDSLDPAARRTIFAKLYTSEKGARVFRVATQVAEWLAEHGKGVTSVRPLAYIAEDAILLFPRVLGAPLCEHLQRPGPGVAQWLERAGAALRTLHNLPQGVAGPLQIHEFAAEIREVERDIAHLRALLPPVGAAIDAFLNTAQELYRGLPQEPPTFTHRDFKCEHLLVARRELTLIDFDRCALADPAFDVGKFLADLQWWFAAYDQEGLEQAQQQFLAGYAPGAPDERLVRARLYEALQLVQMTVLRARLFEHHAARRTARLIGRAQAVMNNLQRPLGLPGPLVNRKRPAAISGPGELIRSAL
jgi:aminoglycoside phosphotransferase (APT) family kinase protein